MVLLLYSRHELPKHLTRLFEFVQTHLPVTASHNVGNFALDDVKVDETTVFFMGNASQLSVVDHKSTIHVIRELTWNTERINVVFPKINWWSVAELPYRVAPSLHPEIYLVPSCFPDKDLYSWMINCIPQWEESIKNKCRKAVLCSVIEQQKQGSPIKWNIMRSNEDLQQPPYQIPQQLQQFLDASTTKYRCFFSTASWSAANHVWAERLDSKYCSMGFHSDRRLDLDGDIRLYTDYSDSVSASSVLREMSADNLSVLFDADQRAQFLQRPGIRYLEVRAKQANLSSTSFDVNRIPMPAKSLLILSEAANQCLQHAIRGQPGKNGLGVSQEALVLTYRGSQTWVQQHKNDDTKTAVQTCLSSNGQPLVYIRKQTDLFQMWLRICAKDNRETDNPFVSFGNPEWSVSRADQLPPVCIEKF